MHTRAWLVCALIGWAALLGCREPDREVVHDLLSLSLDARLVREIETLDFGDRATRIHLDEGWSRDEVAPDGVSFVWSLGERSTFRMFVAEPRELAVRFRCWTFGYSGAPPQAIDVEVNGAFVSSVELTNSVAEYLTTIPAASLERGDNEVSFRYAWHRAPVDVIPGAGDARSLAVAWDWFSLDDTVRGEMPLAGEDTLTLSPHTRLDFLVMLPAGARLGIDDVIPAGDADADLAMSVVTIRGRRDFVLDAHGPVDVTLTDDAVEQLALLSFQVIEVAGPSARLELVKPRIWRTVATAAPRVLGEAPQRRPSILLYVADTLRADRLGVYGLADSPSPRLDSFASDATVFTRAFAQSSWTKASMASVFTGLTPQEHGAKTRTAPLASSFVTLPERLSQLGYETTGFVTNPNVTEPFGFADGFDNHEFLVENDPSRAYVRSNVLTDRALEWVSNRESDEPFFLFLHTMDPHDPYLSGETERKEHDGLELGSMAFMKALDDGRLTPLDDVESRLIELYDAEIRFNDEQFGRLVDGLRERGAYDDMLIVFLSDHGEEFFDHGWWRHGKTLYQEQLHVPLIVKWPMEDGAGKRIDAVAQHIDVVPTLLDYVGAPPAELSGRSLWPLVNGADERMSPLVTSYLELDGRVVESVVVDDVKLVRHLAYDRMVPRMQLFDLSDDPTERRDRLSDDATTAEFLRSVLDHLHATVTSPGTKPVEISPELYEQLRHLGYVQ